MVRRMSLSSFGEQRLISTPRTRTVPEVGRSSPMICRSMVVLPEPLPPSSAITSPASMFRLTPSSTRWSPYWTVKLSTEIAGSAIYYPLRTR